jgi:hypothetical protein
MFEIITLMTLMIVEVFDEDPSLNLQTHVSLFDCRQLKCDVA